MKRAGGAPPQVKRGEHNARKEAVQAGNGNHNYSCEKSEHPASCAKMPPSEAAAAASEVTLARRAELKAGGGGRRHHPHTDPGDHTSCAQLRRGQGGLSRAGASHASGAAQRRRPPLRSSPHCRSSSAPPQPCARRLPRRTPRTCVREKGARCRCADRAGTACCSRACLVRDRDR